MRIVKLALAPLAALALLGPATLAQQGPPSPPEVAPVSTTVVAKPALWKIADEDTTIYLFGTIHLLPGGIEWYDGPLASAFEQSKELVTEIPETSDGQTMNLMLKYGMLPAGQTLRAQMSPDERTRYEGAMTGLSLPP
ncbi:MAG: TraB/GumN family protein, partial [Novosphingobium sp.]